MSTQQSIKWAELSGFKTDLRRLYREVAKRVHPDLTSDEVDRSRRHRLMAEANQAFERGDAAQLAQILEYSGWKPEPAQGAATIAELTRAVRKITLQARLHATFLDRFDNESMKSARRLLAGNLLTATPSRDMQHDVLNFFEEMNMFLHDCYLDQELMWSTFSFSAVRWWTACRNYVFEERNTRNDQTLFSGFEELAAAFSTRDREAGFKPPGNAELVAFLEDERKRVFTEAL